MLFRRLSALSALALPLAGFACGGLSGDTGSPSTLTTIHGTISSGATSTTPPKALSTAIVWFEISPDGTLHEGTNSVPVTGSFPAAFSIDLTAPPPAGAMIDLGAGPGDSAGAGVHYAAGYLVAYDDVNGDGQLDLVDGTASDYPDTVEAAADRFVFYLDKPIPAAFFATSADIQIGLDGSLPRPGYNLMHLEQNYCYASADGGAGTCLSGVIWEPMATPVNLTLGSSPWMVPQAAQELACVTGPSAGFQTDGLVVCPPGASCPSLTSVADFPGALPSADDPAVQCNDPNDFTYSASCTTTTSGVCGDVETTCTQMMFVTLTPAGGPALAPPPGWPCPAQPAPSPAYLGSFAGQQTTRSSGGGSGSGGQISLGGSSSPDAGTPAN